MKILVFLFIFLGSALESAWGTATGPCPESIESVTDPAPVSVDEIIGAVMQLKSTHEKLIIVDSSATRQEVRAVFDLSKVKTKMEQFYRLLYVLQAHATPDKAKTVMLEPEGVRKILQLSQVFRDLGVPEKIAQVEIDKTKEDDPRYRVTFSEKAVKFPLNNGKGFYGFEQGRCQHTQALIFYRDFGFSLRMLGNGNLVARYFEGVDIFGDFGSRGLFPVDLQYVQLHSVEFFQGTKLGKIKAYVSPEEFQKNDHNPLLKVITKLIGNTTVQPIDW